MERTRWYKDKVFYQIWPRSFKDGNGDGMGDLYGVLEKLDYIKSLGVDGIWFSPLYISPGADCGYDIADYMDIAPEFGGMEAFDKVLTEAHKRNLRVIMDLVVNHTSDEHEWFQKSRQRIDPYTDYYIWRPAKKNGKYPNNWQSEFEGDSAWQWDDLRKEYYLHIFAIKQPDLNMDNPLVREEVKKILRFWLDKGVDGFREDVITYISKPEGLPNEHIFPIHRGLTQYNHGPHIHEYLNEFRKVINAYDAMTLAEATLISAKQSLEYIKEEYESDFDMMIEFECMCADCFLTDYIPLPFSLRKLKRIYKRWAITLYNKGWRMLYLENHDHPRIVSRYGSDIYQKESAKMLCAMYMFQQGTPFVYQGQEIGMINWKPEDADMYEDVQTRNFGLNMDKEKRLRLLHRASRDNARTPVQWANKEYGGFSETKPWFYVNESYKTINVEDQENDKDSVLNFYRKTIALRKSLPVVFDGDYKDHCPLSKYIYCYERNNGNQKLLLIASFTDKSICFKAPKNFDIKNAKLILSNYDVKDNGESFKTKAYELRVYLL